MNESNLDRDGMEVLPRDEALRLLASEPVGRLVYVRRSRPAVTPVNFAVDGERVVFHTGRGAPMSQAVRNADVAFEVDHYEPATRSGWSVLVFGRARLVTQDPELARLSANSPRPWAPGSKDYVVTVTMETITGRRTPPQAG